jgi:murein DD-endopeptidase MepM/ murein hydrolase activator NlpD
VVASDSGYVTFAGWDRTGYGNLVIINHGNGFITYYAHLSKILVQRGDSVAVGQRIGSVGCSGTCTGSHLHFEIRQNDVSRNPLGFLP